MGHHHGHSHDHGHHHHHSANKKALLSSCLLISIFMVVEVIGGFITNSLALLSDAGHMLSDAAALGLSFAAIKLGERKATQSKSFGYKRFEIIAAALNGLTLIVISVVIFIEAIRRFQNPPEVQSVGMLTIAVIGLIVNIIAAWILMSGDKENLNVRSAFLHVIGDLLGSVGAIVAALIIYFFGWGIADPIASIIVAILIIISGWRVVKESFHILMEGTPAQVNVKEVKSALLKIAHVKDVHDLHIWSITSGYMSLSCHIAIDKTVGHDTVLHEAQKLLHDQFSIEHSTLQVECYDKGCPTPHETCN
ncbi:MULTISPECIES: cation diffusion facilitator family transporter [Bacillaceae]|uniref:Cobalt-zinc-cadmium efflux system protein n=1 Tax=Peribacillus huizhouensis TaxID=1501239 RepID=A0ABR6CL61_9BACI|nr:MULTISPECIES: cation diffusion facilitator family transporter [Bacillaceae]MBA9025363.1 cobalt-zinc-cadmium efflux system protein [Peribacillus huizhouensis]